MYYHLDRPSPALFSAWTSGRAILQLQCRALPPSPVSGAPCASQRSTMAFTAISFSNATVLRGESRLLAHGSSRSSLPRPGRLSSVSGDICDLIPAIYPPGWILSLIGCRRTLPDLAGTPVSAPPEIFCTCAWQVKPVSAMSEPTGLLVTPKYCESTHQTRRRPTRTIHVSVAAAGQQQSSAAVLGDHICVTCMR